MASAAREFYLSDLWRIARLNPAVAAWVPSFLLAASLWAAFMTPTPQNILTGITWALLGAALVTGRMTRPSKPVALASGVLLASLALSVALASPHERIATAMVAASVAPMALYSLLRVNLHHVMNFIAAGAVINAGVVAVQAIVNGGRAAGLSSSPNPAGGMMALAAVYLMTTRWRWLAIPLTVAIQLTGSRLALAVVVAAALLMALLDARARAAALAVAAVAILTIPLNPRDGLRVYTAAAANIEERLSIERPPEALPSGFVGVGDGPPHSVPVRLAVELGIPAALAWLFLSLRALWRRPSPAWWLLVAIVLLSALDYYVWVGPMAGFWWLLIDATNEQRNVDRIGVS